MLGHFICIGLDFVSGAKIGVLWFMAKHLSLQKFAFDEKGVCKSLQRPLPPAPLSEEDLSPQAPSPKARGRSRIRLHTFQYTTHLNSCHTDDRREECILNDAYTIASPRGYPRGAMTISSQGGEDILARLRGRPRGRTSARSLRSLRVGFNRKSSISQIVNTEKAPVASSRRSEGKCL